jgi:hypothetical protein
MSNDPRVEAVILNIGFLERRVDKLEEEVRKQAEEIQYLKNYFKINPNILKDIVYNKNKGDKK